MKDLYIADLSGLEEGHSFDGFFLLLSTQQRTTRTGKPYLNLTLADKTGQLEARVWDPADPRIARDLVRGDLVKARGSVSRFEDRLQMKVEQIRKAAPTEADRADMLPATKLDVDELWQTLLGFVDSFTEPHLQHLLKTILGDPALARAYREAPAARQLHHAWLGGLLEHVVSLLTLADRVAPHYPLLERDLLLTGVILHDIGKTAELAWESGFEYTIEGTLLGHIHMGVALVEKTIDGLPDFPARLRTLVVHLILSHHGKLEFGSPKLPMIPEALVLNFLDDLDAKMQAVAGEFDKSAREGRDPAELTGRVWALDQRQLLNTRAWLAGEAPEASGDMGQK
ncbi:MAG TPA: OB-fold nucleic acid binding domain-containing protein [Terracidiphilus sp.]|nr:OB-fold nucleic acid binding domain-containing protein [Terracidiphilus sp.]